MENKFNGYRGITYNGNPPCKDCTKRCVGCHSTCQIYLDWRKDYDYQKIIYRVKKANENAVDRSEILARREYVAKKLHTSKTNLKTIGGSFRNKARG